MKTNNNVKTLSCVFCMALLLSACSNNADSSATTAGTTVQAPPVTTGGQKTEITEKEDITEEIAATTEEDTSPNESLFDYYDLLDAEYKKYGITSTIQAPAIGELALFDLNENVVYMDLYGTNRMCFLFDSQETKEVDAGGHGSFFGNGMIYHWSDGVLKMMQYDGEYPHEIIDGIDQKYTGVLFPDDEVWNNIYEIYDLHSNPDGTVFLSCRLGSLFSHDETVHLMVSSDGEKLTVLPKPTIEVDHGFTEEVEYSIVACYNNKVFYFSDREGDFGCIDTDTLTLETKELKYNEEKVYVEWKDEKSHENIKTVGRYLLTKYMIYDMEEDKVVLFNKEFGRKDIGIGKYDPFSFSKTYYGGKYNVYTYKGKWYFLRCPSDGSDMSFDNFESFENPTGLSNIPISDEYYIFVDSYGVFLRRYDGGSKDEATIFLKNNS